MLFIFLIILVIQSQVLAWNEQGYGTGVIQFERCPNDTIRTQRYFKFLEIERKVKLKREETRKERIEGMIERLGKQWKNPANR